MAALAATLMQIVSLPASYGAAWLRDGWRLLKRQPLGLPAMVVIYLLMLLLPAIVPYIGVAISGVLSPFATVGLMGAVREISAGRAPTPHVFAVPFQDVVRRLLLLRLGMIHAALMLVVLTLAQAIARLAPPASEEARAFTELLWQLLLMTPVMILMWFAPLLTGWHGHGPGKAMFGSVIACWRNKGALAVYGLLLFAILLGVSFVTVSVVSLLFSSRQALSIALAPVGLALIAWIQATFYPMYRSIFSN
ncbi:MAG: BPSS1780 family membrane protein [Burkholderiaceae bacterium]|nr:BPSS1780 family membrane protein [Burkholderiaceae bacterium]